MYCNLLCEWGDKSELNTRRYQLLAPVETPPYYSWRTDTSSFHPNRSEFVNHCFIHLINKYLLLPWATYDLCFCYTPSCLGITANELILVFPAICHEMTNLTQLPGYFPTGNVYYVHQKHVTLILIHNHAIPIVWGVLLSITELR